MAPLKARPLLESLLKRELQALAKRCELSGYSRWTKAVLVRTLLETIYPDGVDLRARFAELAESQKILLAMVSEGGHARTPAAGARLDFLQLYSDSTYYAALDELARQGFLFQVPARADDEEDQLVIPARALPVVLEQAAPINEGTAETQTVVVPDRLAGIQALLERVRAEKLRDFCGTHDLPIEGARAGLVATILAADLPLARVLDVPTKKQLKRACREWEISTTGTKREIITRILQEHEGSGGEQAETAGEEREKEKTKEGEKNGPPASARVPRTAQTSLVSHLPATEARGAPIDRAARPKHARRDLARTSLLEGRLEPRELAEIPLDGLSPPAVQTCAFSGRECTPRCAAHASHYFQARDPLEDPGLAATGRAWYCPACGLVTPCLRLFLQHVPFSQDSQPARDRRSRD